MRKILIVKGVSVYDNWGDETFHSDGAVYHEVDDETYYMLRENIYRLSKNDTTYRMIEYAQADEVGDVIATIRKLVAKDAEEALKRKKQREAAAAKAAATKLETKRKQLEKLKKELGES